MKYLFSAEEVVKAVVEQYIRKGNEEIRVNAGWDVRGSDANQNQITIEVI